MSDNELPADDHELAEAEHCPVIPAEELFKAGREVWIDHHGERYKLRITRRGRLILQK